MLYNYKVEISKNRILVLGIIPFVFLSGCTIFSWTVPKEEKATFIFPVSGRITSYFGKRDGEFHSGIDITQDEGAPIKASCDGVVSYSNVMEGYGNVVILLHKDGFSTLYSHCKKALVKTGENVKQGDIIALVGKTGKATASHLHFEIRKNGIPQDPLLYLTEP